MEPTRAGVRQRQCCGASVAFAPGEGGAGTHPCQSRGVIDNDNEDAAGKNNSNYDVVFFAKVAVGAYDVVCGSNSGGDSGGGSWLQLGVSQGVPKEEDQMTAWQAEPATGQGGACRTSWGGGNGELIVTGIIKKCGRP